ncbi:DUF2635 domain-containing protein [Paraburkholderia sp. FT54]|uniref:DUF2635 domain-containing protein n=1 Tax=Paraburkholderia sp. FT54 TaxID=3074437 RepID=UPI0028775AF2|nr:DUF2635 domain-containing protein [Paraburkholderia sp. FT54]WNC90956.1 DUF2635 domain-containing protein [Paraburkholderia sp. FT54]
MRVKPAPGLSVRDPVTKQLLPAEGIDVPDGDIFWTRCLNDKDVVLGGTDDAAREAQANAAGSKKQ